LKNGTKHSLNKKTGVVSGRGDTRHHRGIQRCSSNTGRVGFRRFYAFVLTRRDSPFAGERGLSTAQRSAIWEGNWTGTVVGARANDGSCRRKQAPTAQVRCCRTGDVTQLIFSLREPSQMPHEAHVQKKMPHEASGTDTPFPVCGLLFVLAARSAGIAGDTARPPAEAGRWTVGRAGHGERRIRRRTPATDFGFHSRHAHSGTTINGAMPCRRSRSCRKGLVFVFPAMGR